MRENVGNLRQVFVLTHNIYFHKEVSFDRERRGRALNACVACHNSYRIEIAD